VKLGWLSRRELGDCVSFKGLRWVRFGGHLDLTAVEFNLRLRGAKLGWKEYGSWQQVSCDGRRFFLVVVRLLV
jgi:hypothetical protein